VPSDYPFGLSDDRLDAVIGDMLSGIPGFDNYGRILPELKLTLILIGAQERSRRDADRIGELSLLVAGIVTVIAVVSDRDRRARRKRLITTLVHPPAARHRRAYRSLGHRAGRPVPGR
jgi:hypothetical protein